MGFGYIIFGLFFVLFDFHFQKVNILPNFIGFLLINVGLVEIIGRINNSYLQEGKKTLRILIAFSALEMIIGYSSILNGLINNPATFHGKVFSILFVLTYLTLLIYLFFNLTRGLEHEAKKIEALTLSIKLRSLYTLFFIIQSIIGVLSLVGIIINSKLNFSYTNGGGIALLLFILSFAGYIYLFLQIRAVMKLAEKTFQPGHGT